VRAGAVLGPASSHSTSHVVTSAPPLARLITVCVPETESNSLAPERNASVICRALTQGWLAPAAGKGPA